LQFTFTVERQAIALSSMLLSIIPFHAQSVKTSGLMRKGTLEYANDRFVGRLRKDEGPTTPASEAIKRALPVYIERLPNGHRPAGGHVAYADGHVEWIKWGDKWPLTPEAMALLLALDELDDE
jgi:prepilin-type processing-associated H-X9-DG protein